MKEAMDMDAQSIRKGEPALEKLKYSKTLISSLRNIKIQKIFIFKGGCNYLSEWIQKNKEGFYPCNNIIEDALDLIKLMNIEAGSLVESQLGKIIKKISKETTSEGIRTKAKDLVSKWYRQIYNLDTNYDRDGNHEEQYRRFKKQKMKEL